MSQRNVSFENYLHKTDISIRRTLLLVPRVSVLITFTVVLWNTYSSMVDDWWLLCSLSRPQLRLYFPYPEVLWRTTHKPSSSCHRNHHMFRGRMHKLNRCPCPYSLADKSEGNQECDRWKGFRSNTCCSELQRCCSYGSQELRKKLEMPLIDKANIKLNTLYLSI